MATTTDPARGAPRLGVGVLYNPALPELLRQHIDAVDFISVIPDMFWTDAGYGASVRYREIPSWCEELAWLHAHRPLVAHDIGLSLGSADALDNQYLAQLHRWQSRYQFAWHSDHLSFVQVGVPGNSAHSAGMALPVPFDEEVLAMVAERARAVREALNVPFLLENGVTYVDIPEQDMPETAFLNRMCEQGGCGLLLDLHNLFTNGVNQGFDPHAFLDALELAHVVEIHIAGGNEIAGMHTDSHAGPCPEPVFELLERVVPKAPNLRAITFEFHDSYYPLLKVPGVLEQLARARSAWNHRQEGAQRVPS